MADLERLKRDLVTCTRLLVLAGILDYSGHLSARVPGTGTLLIQPRDASRAALTADDLLVVDLDGALVEGDVPPPAETAIHTGVYRNRPDAALVCHGHPTLSTTFSMTDRPFLPMRHFAYRDPDGLPVHPDATHITTREQGDAVAATLGDRHACLLRAHGTVLVAPTVQELLMDCLDLEENARTLLAATQLTAGAGGGELRPLSPDECAEIGRSYSRSRHRPNKLWEHYVHRGTAAGIL